MTNPRVLKEDKVKEILEKELKVRTRSVIDYSGECIWDYPEDLAEDLAKAICQLFIEECSGCKGRGKKFIQDTMSNILPVSILGHKEFLNV